MAITASGLFGLTIEKALIDTLGESIEAEDVQGILVTDSLTPDFDTMDFVNDITSAEVAGGGDYAREAVTSTELTISSGVLVWDAADQDYGAAVTIAAMAQALATEAGADSADQLIALQDFVSEASSTAGQFTVQHHANGIVRIDYTP